jgi:uncharacterized alkaline shock family protein YloU
MTGVATLKTIDRVILIATAVIIVFLGSVVLASVSGGGFPNAFAIAFYDSVASNRIAAAIIGIAIVLVTLYVIMMALRVEESAEPIITGTGLGDVQISMAAVEAIAQRAAQKVDGVRNVEAAAEGNEDGITLHARINVYPDVSIPEVCENLERELSEAMHAVIGLPVKSIHTVVKGVSRMESKPRP